MKQFIFNFIMALGIYICHFAGKIEKIGGYLYNYGAQSKYDVWVSTLDPISDTAPDVAFPSGIVRGGCEVQTGCFHRVDCIKDSSQDGVK